MKNFLCITDLTKRDFDQLFAYSRELKSELKKRGGHKKLPFFGKTLAMIYEKPSLRTRISFEVGATQLGGHAIYLGPNDIQMGSRETPSDIGRVTGSMADMIMARVFKHQTVVELAEGAQVPVINGLSDLEHPCQAIADFMTIEEEFGTMSNLKIVFVGDGNNNVTHSLALLSAMYGNHFVVISPKGFEMSASIRKKFNSISRKTNAKLTETTKIDKVISDADVVVADTWVSMGREEEKAARLKTFAKYQVTREVMNQASDEAIFLHCLPAYRGKEVATEVIDGPQSRIFPEAENRLHAQKGLMVWLLEN